MGYAVRVVADSLNPVGVRLTTVELTYPRMVHQDLLTHRALCRNADSSRARSVKKKAGIILTEGPAMSLAWVGDATRMDEGALLPPEVATEAERIWRDLARTCAEGAIKLAELGVHRQHANRPIDWCSWVTVVLTATDWRNLFQQRCHPKAQGELRHAIEMVRGALAGSTPTPLRAGWWHLPYITPEELADVCANRMGRLTAARFSAARCARVSYLNQGAGHAIDDDLRVWDALTGEEVVHWSPLEHPCRARADGHYRQSPVRGWTSLRKTFPGERGEG